MLINHIMGGGWVEETMKLYNSGIKKYVKFNEQKGRRRSQCLPVTKELIYKFIPWASERQNPDQTPDEAVKADTVRKYIVGLRTWHRLHQCQFLDVDDELVKLMLRASKRYEKGKIQNQSSNAERSKTKERGEKEPVLVSHLDQILAKLEGKGNKATAIIAVSMVAFWGLARLGELVLDKPSKKVPVLDDLSVVEGTGNLKLAIHDAKTAKQNKIQYLVLKKQSTSLDPV
ncbi:hypothetical protein DFH28DRAFT_888240 [Melampsora americana]|nr:hypothetical protein DFH28DRAFT_888240 [Melampsora americana]